MNDWFSLNRWLVDDASYRLVVTLLHFVWQAAILGVVACLVTLALRKYNDRHAYGVNVAFQACMVVVGLLKPMILLPTAMIGGLKTSQLESILAHEMADIRRFEPWVSLRQRIVESALFFHPAVWLVSRRIDIERDKVADDVALQAGCDPTQYADSLLRMAELSAELRATLFSLTCAPARERGALAMTGRRPSGLKSRVIRLLGRDASQTMNARQLCRRLEQRSSSHFFSLTTTIAINGGLSMNTDSTDEPSQVMRDTFAAAIKANDLQEVETLLQSDPKLANADLREA